MTQQKQIIQEIDKFVTEMMNVKEEEKKVRKHLTQLDERINKLEKISLQPPDGMENNHFWKDFKKGLDGFSRRIKQLIEKYQKDKIVLDAYAGQLVVLVYGMVKAGKSALGNFMAGVPIKQLKKEGLLKEPSLYDKIDISIEVWKDGKKQIEKEFMEFEEDAVEATNRIQVFRLGGLTWVDTPGTGSMTRENAKIAQEFIDNADLIVFLTSSENPLRKQDIEEIKQLHFKEKPWLIVISKSDTTKSDVID